MSDTIERLDLGALVDRAIREWGRPKQMRAVLVKGSAGLTGIVPLGGDLDLLIVTDTRPADEWFVELRVEDVPVEIFVTDEDSLRDREEILRHQSLAIELVDNLHIHDPDGILASAREAVRPRLMDSEFVLARALASLAGAKESLTRARMNEQLGHSEDAARDLSICLWHGAAAAASAAGLTPTTRRCLVLWADVAERFGWADQLRLLEMIGRPPLDPSARTHLVQRLATGDDRVAAAVEGMVTAGEERWIGWPLVRSVLWKPVADRHGADVRAEVLRASGWMAAGISERLAAAAELLRHLEASIPQLEAADARQRRGRPSEIDVRDATEADIPQLVALKGAGSDSLHRDRVRDARRGGFRYLVAARRDEVIGFGCLVFERPAYWSDGADRTRLPQLVDLRIAVAERARGHGTHLIRTMAALAGSAGFREVHVSVGIENRRARTLYRRLGYREVADVPRYVSWSFEDSTGTLHSGDDRLIDMVRPVDRFGR